MFSTSHPLRHIVFSVFVLSASSESSTQTLSFILHPLPRRESPANERFTPANQAGRNHRSGLRGLIPASCREVSLLSTIPASFCGGNQRLGYLPAALPLSYSNFRRRQESNLRPSEPDVTQAFTTPQTLRYFSLPPYFVASLFPSAHTSSITLKGSYPFAGSARFKNPGRNQRPRSFGFRTRRPIGLSVQEVPVNYTIPGAFFRQKIAKTKEFTLSL